MQALRLAQRLKARGHEIVIFAANEKVVNKQLVETYTPYIKSRHSLADWPVVRRFIYKLNPLFRRLGFGDAMLEKARSWVLRSVIKLEKVDLVCSHSPRSDVICKKAMKNLDIPLVMIEHGIYSHYLFQGKKALLNPLLAATGIVSVSHFCTGQMKRFVGEAGDVTTIYNGVEIELPHSRAQVRQELGIQEGEIAFGFGARGRPKKGWQAAIEAFLKVKAASHKKVHLVLVGGSTYVDELKEKYGQHSEIHFIGKVPDAAYYLDAVDVGLMLSLYPTEALSLIAIEFLMLGKPVISTNVGGVPEVFEVCDESMYQLINLEADGSLDTNKLKDVMLSFAAREKALTMQPKQIEPVLKKFSMDTCVDAYDNFFQQAVSKGNSNGKTPKEKKDKSLAVHESQYKR